MAHAIGIDLGTTNTVVAAVVDGVALTLEDEQQRRLLPSVVSFHPSGNVLVGEAARERRLIDPENTIFSIKPLLGRAFDSEAVRLAVGRFPFRFVEGSKSSTMVMARDAAYALPEISAYVLRRAKAVAEHALRAPVDRAVITVPANFNDLQRASTKIAGRLAGLDVLRILNEPTAAALAYGQSSAKTEKIAVYDLGGGTFDITLLDLAGNVFEVLATAGDTALGGDDFDRLLAERLALDILKQCKFDPRTSPAAFARLHFLAEEMKKRLSTESEIEQEVNGFGVGEGGAPLSAKVRVTRSEFETIARPLLERTVAVAKRSIEVVGLHPKDFDRVILVGGSTRMPLVTRFVEQLFGRAPHLNVNPDEVVALGAAIQAHALNRPRASVRPKAEEHSRANTSPNVLEFSVPPVPLVPSGVPQLDIPTHIEFSKAPAVITFSPPPAAPHPLAEPPAPSPARPARSKESVSRVDGRAAVESNLGRPDRGAPREPFLPVVEPAAEASQPSPLNAPDLDVPLGAIVAAGDFFPSFDPPQAVSDAAFARGSAIETLARAPLLIDVTPLSLRVETVGGYSDVLITANSPVPCEKTRTFLTASENQTVVFIRVAQGESNRFAENTRLGELELSGLTPAPRGEVKIMVTFELDADGILNVAAREKDTNRETRAVMRLIGAETDPAELDAMAARQVRDILN